MKVALVDAFPNRAQTAEREFISRSRIAMERLGWFARRVVTSDEICDFGPDVVIATHEFTPKLTEHPTVGLMWSPVAHFSDDEHRVRAVRSYDGYFSGSDSTTQFLKDQLFAMAKAAPIVEPFAPSCQATDWGGDPAVDGLFYVGTNWDGGRHGELFKLLEQRLPLRVHGPRGCWDALRTGYAGEVAFDGGSVLAAIRRCGVALCLNSFLHNQAGLPSARLFEAAAAGAIIITEALPLVRRHFGDSVFHIDHSLRPTAKAEAIAAAWDEIRTHPKRAREMARAAHEILNERLCLEKLYAPLPDMLGEMRHAGGWLPPAKPKEELPTVEYIVRIGGRPAGFVRRCLESLASQTWPNIAVLLVRYQPVDGLDALIAEFSPRLRSLRVVEAPPGLRSTSLWVGLNHLQAPFFGNQDDDDLMHPNHVASVMAALERHGDVKFAYSGTIRVEEEDGHYVSPVNFGGEFAATIPERRELTFLHAPNPKRLMAGSNYIQSNAWIARKELLKPDVLCDPQFEVAEDVYLYMLFLRDTDFVTSWRPTIEWNWRSTSKDNSMHRPEKWGDVHHRIRLRLEPDFSAMFELIELPRVPGSGGHDIAVHQRVRAKEQQAAVERATALAERSIADLRGLPPEEAISAARAKVDALNRRKRLPDAEAAIRAWLTLRPEDPDALVFLGCAREMRRDPVAARDAYERAARVAPHHAAAHANLGNMLAAEGRCAAALARYARALELDQSLTSLYGAMADLMRDHGWLEEAIPLFATALAADPSQPYVHSNMLLSLNYIPGRSGLNALQAHGEWARVHAEALYPAVPPQRNRDPDRRLRVGIVSGDFRTHAVASFLLPLVEGLDRSDFEVFCYSHTPDEDWITDRFKAVSVWRPLGKMDDEAMAAMVQADRIDILVDTAGHTCSHRLLCFARKPAPVQVTWLGYPNTTGLRAMDYRFTDPTSDPVGVTDAYNVESLVRLPNFLCFRAPTASPDPQPPPCLHKGYVTFGSFNNISKINPQCIALWAEIMHRVPESRMLLKHYAFRDEDTRARHAELFSANGIVRDRLALLPPVGNYADHLALYGHVDVALDSFPYNGTTTTMEALWMGVPVVTLLGDQHFSRVGGSILTLLGAGEWIAHDPAQLVERATTLAARPGVLATLRTDMRRRLAASPLMDEKAFCRAFGTALRSAWRRWCLDEAVGPGPNGNGLGPNLPLASGVVAS